MNYSIKAIQTRLNELGYQAGSVDGIRGKRTINAVKALQKRNGLTPDGIVGKLTVAALFGGVVSADEGPDSWPWLTEGLRVLGYHEVTDNAALKRWLASDGRTLGDPKKLPWCGDFAETCILRALPDEPVPTNPYWARSWIGFGVYCKPRIGAVMVFSRGEKSGHVGFYLGETKTHFIILGGNQGNRVSRSTIERRRLISSRWPSTVPLGSPKRLIVAASGHIEETTNEE